MKSPDNKESWPPSGQTHPDSPNDNEHSTVIGNKRLTALVSGVLLVLLLIELVTVPNLRPLLSLHVFVGVFVGGPLALKLGSTGYKFVRYYTHTPAFVREGPPRLWLRALAPLLVATTLVVFGSGVGLLLTAPTQPSPLRPIHIISFVIWLPLLMVHLFAHFPQVPSLIADDWTKLPTLKPPIHGRTRRLVVNLSALLIGGSAAILTLPLAAAWISWFDKSEAGPGPFIVAMVASLLALIATRPFRK